MGARSFGSMATQATWAMVPADADEPSKDGRLATALSAYNERNREVFG